MLNQSSKKYLESIISLLQVNDHVRGVDIARYLGYSKPSVTRALQILKEEKLIILRNRKFVQLTEEGRKIAEQILDRHAHIKDFFMLTLGIDRTQAEIDACRIENEISEQTFNKIKQYVHERVKHLD